MPLCPKPFSEVFITINGDIFPCCSAQKSLGNINSQDIEEIWNKGFQEIREQMNRDELPPQCKYYCLIRELGIK